jgi:hypothetical protein
MATDAWHVSADGHLAWVMPLREQVASLMRAAKLRPELPQCILPANDKIGKLDAQVFYTPNLSSDAKKRRTVWSLRLTVWIGEVKAKDEINVNLFPRPQWVGMIERLPGSLPEHTKRVTNTFDDEEAWFGFVRAKTNRKGSPYVRHQFCVVLGLPEVVVPDSRPEPPDALRLMICNGDYWWPFKEWRIAAGEKREKALWWGETMTHKQFQ